MVAQNVTSLGDLEARLLVSLSAARKSILSVKDTDEALGRVLKIRYSTYQLQWRCPCARIRPELL